MKLSYNWLKEYLKCELSPEQIAQAMTSIGIEVDGIESSEQIPGGLKGVVVAQVLECEVHPDSDHLHITKVDAGAAEVLTVVCGAPNVAKGQKVLFAQIGTVLPGDFKIKKSKIRGVESFGMICAEDELGIGTSHDGIMVLSDDAIVGTSAKEYLNLKTETVIEYEITANRVDAASHWGVARDLYAYLSLNGIPCTLVAPSVEFETSSLEGKGIEIDVLDQSGAPRYSGITVSGISVEPSPKWLQDKLLSIGLRPINNIVDISNFVLFELGQPLHTFDADKIIGGKVLVRRALKDEKIVTLDEVERQLCENDMVIANSQAAMCIAGVFGGSDSGISENSKNLFIESAYFDPGSIRKTSKSQGLSTDASFRYERGADPEICVFALKRALKLVLEIAGGTIVGDIKDNYPTPFERKSIELNYNRIERFIGKNIGGAETIKQILTYLGYSFVSENEEGAVVLAPTYMVDVYRECDVVEEILRIYGYNNIDLPSRMRMSVNPSPKPDPEALRNGISNFLSANGFNEIMNNSLTKSAYYEGLSTFPLENCVQIVNPLSQDLNVLRQTLLFSGLEVVAYNINRQCSSLKVFEYGSVYQKLSGKPIETLEGYEEHQCFSLLISGNSEKSWRNGVVNSDFYQLKAYFELLLKRFGADIYSLWMDAAPSDIFSEGTIYKLPGKGEILATIGTVSPSICKKFGIKQAVYACEICWPVLFNLVKRNKVTFTELPKFPEVRRDLALLLDEGVKYSELRAAAFKVGKKLLKQVGLFDVYRGDKIPQGKKQYALSFVIQDSEKTLTDQDTERVMANLLSVFTKDFGAILR